MKEKLLDLLACPSCGGDILLAYVSKYLNKEIIEAVLNCRKCDREYKVERGVPRFASLDKIEQEKADTAEVFGWQWKQFTQENDLYAEQLLGWLKPVKPEFFEKKLVLEAGCGKGRHTTLAAKWGAKQIIGVDLSAAVETAFQATKDLPNAHIVQADIYKLPFKKVFDYAFCVGVLHHTPDPKKAFISLASKVKKGGAISAWVYGEENNDWIINYVNPIREGFTSKMNQPTLYHLSKLPTLGVFLASKLIYYDAV